MSIKSSKFIFTPSIPPRRQALHHTLFTAPSSSSPGGLNTTKRPLPHPPPSNFTKHRFNPTSVPTTPSSPSLQPHQAPPPPPAPTHPSSPSPSKPSQQPL